MAIVTNRLELVDYCMRSLGAPVIEINVDEDQVDDRIDEALEYYQMFHDDAVIRNYFKHQLTLTDIDNSYITMPTGITSVTKLLAHGSQMGDSLFDVKYHMRLQDVFAIGGLSSNIQSYVQRMENIELIDGILNTTEHLRFNRHMNRLHIDEGFDDLVGSSCSDLTYTTEATCVAASKTWTEGSWIVVEGYEIVDPQTYTDVYNDMFLKRYCTVLIKRQWGQNMMKFDGFTLPGGITMNGRQMYEDAIEEISKLEEEMQLAWQAPDNFIMG
jgi:hypothetical protein